MDDALAAGTVYVAGNVNVDMILGPLAQWPRVGTETILPDYELRVGGQAGNAGLALAALGALHRVVANVGDDPLGRWLADAFPGSSAAWPRASAPTTVTVGLLHTGGERTFFTNVGHLSAFSPDQLLAQLPARAARGDLVLLCGLFLSPLLVASGRQLCEQLVQRGFALALDPGWPTAPWDAVRATVASWLPFVRHVLLNDLETLALAEGAPDLDRAAAWLQARLPNDATVVVKCGPRGARAWRGPLHLNCPALAVRVIDTVGAGDAFNAGYLSGIASGLPLKECVARGIRVASQVISTSPRRYAPERADADLRP
jgi:sugar/nucleoside kinase (ribokinase family)